MSKPPFSHNGITYGLAHLNAFTHTYVRPAKDDKPEVQHTVTVYFEDHTYTRGAALGDDPALSYPSSRPRSFDVGRWELSHHLPDLIRGLGEQKISFTNPSTPRTFLAVRTLDGIATRPQYEIYFTVKQTSTGLELNVTSAYVRDPERLADRPKWKPMTFFALLHKVANNEKISRPP